MTVYQSCTQEDNVYMDEQIEVSEDLQKEGGLGEDIEPWSDDSAGGEYCKAYDIDGQAWHIVTETGYNQYKCTVRGAWGSVSTHKTGMTISLARAHCTEIQQRNW